VRSLSTTTLHRLLLTRRRKQWRRDHPFGFFAKPMRGANGMMDLKKWDCGVPGKEKTIWEGGLFKLEVTFPDEYPTKPPKCEIPLPFQPLTHTSLICLTAQANSRPRSSTPTSTPPAPSASRSSTRRKAGSLPSLSRRSCSVYSRCSTSRTQTRPRRPMRSIYSRRTRRRMRRRSGASSRRIRRRRESLDYGGYDV
jgi:hypothetical protein